MAPTVVIPARGWTYEVQMGPGGRELHVEAGFAAGARSELSVDMGSEPFVRDVERATTGGWKTVSARGTSWFVDECPENGCRIRYRYLIDEAARRLHDLDSVTGQENAFLATPSNWLLRPWESPGGSSARIHVTTPPGLSFISGMYPSPDGAPNTYEMDVADLEYAPYTGIGAFRHYEFSEQGVQLELAISPSEFQATDSQLIEWARRAVHTMGLFYGTFPVKRLALFVAPARGSEVWFGTTLGTGGAGIIVLIGSSATDRALKSDWVLDHEIVHLATPRVVRKQRWFSEGLATYIEPIARAHQGRYPIDSVWRDLVRNLPQGLPSRGDSGLDNTPTWGRTYWGGALFCMMADVEIRERTGNAKGLDDALRAIHRAGGDISAHWNLERTLAEGDRGVGVPVLSELYRRMANAPVEVDLPALWKRLGVQVKGDKVSYDEQAPLTAIRRSIVSGNRMAQVNEKH